MTYSKDKWRQRVAREFGAPAKMVIKSFAETGYSKRLCAGSIGITRQTLIRYCLQEGIKFPDRNHLRDECKARPSYMPINNPWGRCGKPQETVGAL